MNIVSQWKTHLLVLGCSALPTIANAVPIIPDATGVLSHCSSIGNGNSCQRSYLPFPGSYSAPDDGQASALLDPLMVNAYSDSYHGFSMVSDALINYHYAVVGPTDGLIVPLLVDVLMQTVQNGIYSTDDHGNNPVTAVAEASINVFGATNTSRFIHSDNRPGSQPAPAEFLGTLSFNARTGAIGDVRLTASSTVTGAARGIASAHAFVDPFIYIDPSFVTTHSGYSVIVSNGVANAPREAIRAVPEPSSPTLVLMGLCLIYMVIRRKQRFSNNVFVRRGRVACNLKMSRNPFEAKLQVAQ